MSVPSYELRVSSRRKKTASARFESGRLVVTVPSHLSQEERLETASRLADRFALSVDLSSRAQLMAALLPEVTGPYTIKWVENQGMRWGSCTWGSSSIRISSRLKRVPSWVLDAVIFHELAHLVEPNHGPKFKKLLARCPRYSDAQIFLEGFSYGASS